MSRFVHSIVNSVSQYHIDYACDGVCLHVSIGKPAHIFGEQDIFGPVTRFLYCGACYAQMGSTNFVDNTVKCLDSSSPKRSGIGLPIPKEDLDDKIRIIADQLISTIESYKPASHANPIKGR